MTDAHVMRDGNAVSAIIHALQLGDALFGLLLPLVLGMLEECRWAPARRRTFVRCTVCGETRSIGPQLGHKERCHGVVR